MSTKRVSDLHGLSFRVRYSCGWRSCTFSFLPDFVAKTQNPSIPDSRFEEFCIPSLEMTGTVGQATSVSHSGPQEVPVTDRTVSSGN